jgi:vesicle coat complex subunit
MSTRTALITDCRKEAIQKTIMAMTLGKDVSALFPDVLKNIATTDLDQKKLVYLYLMLVVIRFLSIPYR